jgi:hypothetical protein
VRGFTTVFFSILLWVTSASALAATDDVSTCIPVEDNTVYFSDAQNNVNFIMSKLPDAKLRAMAAELDYSEWIAKFSVSQGFSIHFDQVKPIGVCEQWAIPSILQDSVCGRATMKTGSFDGHDWHLEYGLQFESPASKLKSSQNSGFHISLPGAYTEIKRSW